MKSEVGAMGWQAKEDPGLCWKLLQGCGTDAPTTPGEEPALGPLDLGLPHWEAAHVCC